MSSADHQLVLLILCSCSALLVLLHTHSCRLELHERSRYNTYFAEHEISRSFHQRKRAFTVAESVFALLTGSDES